MTSSVVVAGVDLGASGGRVLAARVSPEGVALHEVSRFPNEPVLAGGTLHWDILRLYSSVVSGLRSAASSFSPASAGIDSWGVDYGLLDSSGALVGNPVHYRDPRTNGVSVPVPAASLYSVTGIQHLPFNTIYQLAASLGTPSLSAASTLLLIPDLLAYWLTGAVGAEVTNASTTALLDVSSRKWAVDVIDAAGIPRGLFPPLRQPGDVIGPVRELPDVTGVPLIAVGSHDTASAVAAVPASSPAFAYISSGTWSLAGLELTAPVLSEESRLANFTNEAGIDGTIRYLRNVTGLWLLQECVRCWGDSAGSPGRIVSWLAARGLPAPAEPAEIVRCILDSLALAYRRALLAAQSLSGRHADVVHIVGGGSKNELLCQLTADALGLPVVAGPAEATAVGNVLVQARALGRRHRRWTACERCCGGAGSRCALIRRPAMCGRGRPRPRALAWAEPRSPRSRRAGRYSRARPRRAACWARRDRRRSPLPRQTRRPARHGRCSRRRPSS
jgi:sugar (pentulose or hexulose) kinase